MALGKPTLTTIDPAAVDYILRHPEAFPKQASLRRQLARYLDVGLVVAEGSQHKWQRKMLSVAFSSAQMKRYHDVLAEGTVKLKEKLEGTLSSTAEWREVDMLDWSMRWSEDAIGVAGFGEDLGRLDFRDTTLSKAFEASLKGMGVIGPMWLFQAMVPLIDYIPNPVNHRINQNRLRTRKLCRMRKTEQPEHADAGLQLIFEKRKKAIVSEFSGDGLGEDILSVMLKTHVNEDIPAEDRSTDNEIIAQISTLVLAAKSNAGLAASWGLYELARHPDQQGALRKEMSKVGENPSYDDLVDLPYLNAVIREVLRVRPPVPQTLRTTSEATIIPFATPLPGEHGVETTSLLVKKGTAILITIVYANKSPALWGPTSAEFDPTRFLDPKATIPDSAGVWGHLMTFIGGPRGCIGFQFALAELRLFFFLMIRHFEFRVVPEKQIERWPAVKCHPVVLGEEDKGHQLPLLVRRL